MINTTFRLAPWADVLYACDEKWWDCYAAEVAATTAAERWTVDVAGAAKHALNWIEGVVGQGLCKRVGRLFLGGNSGYQAVGLAYQWGAARIVLLGYDMQQTGGRAHWHKDHPGRLGNIGMYEAWVGRFVELARDLLAESIQVINATRVTALSCFRQQPIDEALDMQGVRRPAPLLLTGMLGLGDNLHQRAIVRGLIKQGREVWLETPWPCVYHDLAGAQLKLLPRASSLRTQTKNLRRERENYTRERPPQGADTAQVWYTHADIRARGSFLSAMANNAGVEATAADFRLPIPAEWDLKARAWLDVWKPTKPLMLFRPLVERTEWSGCTARNPNASDYERLAKSISDRFFVVSVADLAEGVEWISGADIDADVKCHHGELDFETLAALAARSGLVFCSPGFALVMAQAVGARLVAVFGGHESSRFYEHGDPRQLLIDPAQPCDCFSKTHRCNKRIGMAKALIDLSEFLDASDAQSAIRDPLAATV